MSINQPLADRMRPTNIDEYYGQRHLVGPGKVIRRMIESGQIKSLILWGPPGVGKTTLAQIIANTLDRPFYTLSAVSSGVKDVREVIDKAKKNKFFDTPNPILFIDEIHRFNKAQQDSLLGAVEQGVITLVGATTENPSFEVISPLLSRCQVYILKALEVEDLQDILTRALSQDVILKDMDIEVRETESLFRISGGDARKLLNVLEITINALAEEVEDGKPIVITDDNVMEKIQQNLALYDKNGEQHYDLISAFIKSIRGSDPNAAIYYLARMLAGGEDPLFIARRLVILAAEDIGLANPNALLLANNCFQAVHQIGMPEGRIPLSETAIYLASSPKSNSAIVSIDSALEMVKTKGDLSVPLSIRNAPTSLMKTIGYGKEYKYAHDYEGNFAKMDFLPKEINNHKFYEPQSNPKENEIRQRLRRLWQDKYGY